MYGIESELLERAEHALEHLPEIAEVHRVRLRWVGHRLHGDAIVFSTSQTATQADQLAIEAEASIKKHMPNVDEMTIRVRPLVTSELGSV